MNADETTEDKDMENISDDELNQLRLIEMSRDGRLSDFQQAVIRRAIERLSAPVEPEKVAGSAADVCIGCGGGLGQQRLWLGKLGPMHPACATEGTATLPDHPNEQRAPQSAPQEPVRESLEQWWLATNSRLGPPSTRELCRELDRRNQEGK